MVRMISAPVTPPFLIRGENGVWWKGVTMDQWLIPTIPVIPLLFWPPKSQGVPVLPNCAIKHSRIDAIYILEVSTTNLYGFEAPSKISVGRWRWWRHRMMVMMTKITGWRKKGEGCSPEKGERRNCRTPPKISNWLQFNDHKGWRGYFGWDWKESISISVVDKIQHDNKFSVHSFAMN